MNNLKFSLFLVIIISTIIPGCKGEKTDVEDNVLDIRLKEDPQRINPIIFPGAVARLVHQYIYLPLADYHPETLQLTPIVLESVPVGKPFVEGEITDGVSFDLQIKKDAVWEDGQPITGNDYLFTVKMFMFPKVNASAYRNYFTDIYDITIDNTDSKKFTVRFSDDYMLAREAAITIPILPAHIYDPQESLKEIKLDEIRNPENADNLLDDNPDLAQFVTDMNGMKYSREVVSNCGPYRLVSWDTDRNLVLERKENYWGNNYPDNPFLQSGPEKMYFYIIPDETTALTQVKDGSLDVINAVSTDKFLELQQNELLGDQFQFFTPSLMRYYYLGINNSDPILADVDVRKALTHLLDVDQIIEKMEYGMGVRTKGPIHPARKYYFEDLEEIPYDAEMAKRILVEDGWQDVDGDGDLDKIINGETVDLTIDMYVSEQPLGQAVALMLKENAAKVGININIVTKSFRSIITENVRTRNYGITALVSNQDLNDDDPFGRWHSDNDRPDRNNNLSYHNDEVDRILQDIRDSESQEERYDLYRQFQKEVYDDYPAIFLYAPTEKIIVSNRWKASATVKRPGYMANTFFPVNS